jgi:hypothetical protein
MYVGVDQDRDDPTVPAKPSTVAELNRSGAPASREPLASSVRERPGAAQAPTRRRAVTRPPAATKRRALVPRRREAPNATGPLS